MQTGLKNCEEWNLVLSEYDTWKRSKHIDRMSGAKGKSRHAEISSMRRTAKETLKNEQFQDKWQTHDLS